LNHTNDTIIIKTQAALDETWKFISLPQNSYIEAKVISINSELVLGITDLVKTVSLQAKNSVGNNIVYYLNDQTIKISQHYGLTKMLDIYLLKDTLRRDTTAYFLAGKTTPSIGIQPFSIGDVYNLEVGDIFHYKGCVSFNGNQDHKYEIRRILSKTVSVNRDTLIYQIEDCMVDSLPHPPPNIIRTFDTITVKYFLSSLSWEDIILQKLPMEFYNDNMSASMYTLVLKYNGRPEHSRRTRKWIYNFDSCWSNYNAYSYVIYRYSPGLGQTYHYYRNYDMSALTVITDSLVYFQRGSEAWGIPVSTNCNTLVGVESIFKSAEKVLKVVPNPIGEYAEVIIPGLRSGEQATLELYNNLGQGIMKENITYSPYILRRYNFPPGMYLIMVMSADGRIIGRIKIVFR